MSRLDDDDGPPQGIAEPLETLLDNGAPELADAKEPEAQERARALLGAVVAISV